MMEYLKFLIGAFNDAPILINAIRFYE